MKICHNYNKFNLIQSHYYKWVKISMTMLGQWPYLPKMIKIVLPCSIIVYTMVLSFPAVSEPSLRIV